MTAPASAFLPFAERLADAARAAIAPHLGAAAHDKGADGRFDPVTEADRAAERAMRALIEAEHPDHGVSGEEYGDRPGAGRWCWSLDPIDGTRAFICGLPGWTSLIALLDGDEPVLGIIDAPAVDERYIGLHGEAWQVRLGERRRLRTSGCTALETARLSTTDPYLFAGAEAEAFERVRGRVRLGRYGYDAYAYARLAAGGIDLVIESGLKPHDIHALVPVVRGAGGVVANWRGGPDLEAGTIVAAASEELLGAAVELLQG